jgi:nucleotide-binding universal stress UspA family protein
MSHTFKILIAYDGSSFADAALDDLANAGLAEKVIEAHVVSVAEVWLPPENPEGLRFPTAGLRKQHEQHVAEFTATLELAQRAADRLKGRFPDWSVSSEATYGSPAWEILFAASKFRPDLIVVGAKGLSAMDRLLIGSVSQKVVTEADTSVRVARGKVEVDDTPSRIILAYDGSPGSEAALEAMLARNWREGSDVKVVIVSDSAHVRSTLDIAADQMAGAGERLVARIKAAGLGASCTQREGNPKHAIVEEAETWRADCIFTGATGYSSAFAKYIIGSVSAAVAERAPCSVEVVRPNGYAAD